MDQHFFKTLVLFTGMILIGLFGIFLVSHYGDTKNDTYNKANVAK